MAELSLPPSLGLELGTLVTGVAAISGRALLTGFACEETTGLASARFVLRDGGGSGAPMRVPVRLSANESRADQWGPSPVLLQRGLYVDVTSGSVAVVVFIIPEYVMTQDQRRAVFAQAESGYYELAGVNE